MKREWNLQKMWEVGRLYEALMEFPEVCGSLRKKIPSTREVWIFSRTAHCSQFYFPPYFPYFL